MLNDMDAFPLCFAASIFANRHLAAIFVFLATIGLGACSKKKKPTKPTPVKLSPQIPAISQAPENTDEEEEEGWEYQPPEPPKLTPTNHQPKARNQPPTRAVYTDAQIATLKQNRDRAATHKAVDRAINAVQSDLKACYERHSHGPVVAKVKLKVNQSGYIVHSKINNVSSELATCLDRHLRTLKVQGVQTESILVDRTIRFTER